MPQTRSRPKRYWRRLGSPAAQLTVVNEYGTRKAAEIKFKITLKSLAKTNLVVRLEGIAKKDDRGEKDQRYVYVQRDDMRQLCQNLHQQVEIEGYIEDPARFNLDLANAVVKHFEVTERLEFADYGKTRWESTYNSKDLDPMLNRKDVNDLFTKTQGKDEWRMNTGKASEVEGGLSIGPVKLGGGGKSRSSYSSAGLRAFLSEKGLPLAILKEK